MRSGVEVVYLQFSSFVMLLTALVPLMSWHLSSGAPHIVQIFLGP
jgi:hypothetical protein